MLGAALGSIFTGVFVIEQRRNMYKTILNNEAQVVPQSQIREPIFGKKSRLEFSHLWNKAVDQTFGHVIESFSTRGK